MSHRHHVHASPLLAGGRSGGLDRRLLAGCESRGETEAANGREEYQDDASSPTDLPCNRHRQLLSHLESARRSGLRIEESELSRYQLS